MQPNILCGFDEIMSCIGKGCTLFGLMVDSLKTDTSTEENDLFSSPGICSLPKREELQVHGHGVFVCCKIY